MLQMSVPNVLFFLDICCKCVYLDVAYVSHISCKCFIWMLRTGCNGFQVLHVFLASVSDTCFKCFICLWTYVANVSSMCFKSRSSVAHVTMAPVASGQWLAAGLRLLPHAFLMWHASLSPLPPLPPLPFPPSRRGSSSSTGNPTRRVRKHPR
jgi:hypothetical protein